MSENKVIHMADFSKKKGQPNSSKEPEHIIAIEHCQALYRELSRVYKTLGMEQLDISFQESGIEITAKSFTEERSMLENSGVIRQNEMKVTSTSLFILEHDMDEGEPSLEELNGQMVFDGLYSLTLNIKDNEQFEDFYDDDYDEE